MSEINNKKRIEYCPVCYYKLEENFVYCPICGDPTGQGDTDAEAEVLAREAEEFIALGEFEKAERLLLINLESSPVNSRYLTSLVRATSKNYTDHTAARERLTELIARVDRAVPEERRSLLPKDYLSFVKEHKEKKEAKVEPKAAPLSAVDILTARKGQTSDDAKRREEAKVEPKAAPLSAVDILTARKEQTSDEAKRREEAIAAGFAFDGAGILKKAPVRDGKVSVPDFITAIGSHAFSACKNLREVIIPSGVTRIEPRSFHFQRNLTKISLPDTLTSIGEDAFFYCKALGEIELPNSLSYIGPAAFKCCDSLRSIRIPAGVKHIFNDTFSLCLRLESIELPEGLMTVGERAFSFCHSLKRIVIPKTVSRIDPGAFDCCYALEEISVSSRNPYYISANGNLYSKDLKTLVRYASGKKDAEFSVPRGITEIGKQAFSSSKNLKRINLPDGLTTVGVEAFAECRLLSEITIPKSVKRISGKAFADTALTRVTVPKDCRIAKTSFPEDCEIITV